MNGSLDSMDKSQFNSSLEEDTQSYDIYEAHNPNAATVPSAGTKSNFVDLTYQNHGKYEATVALHFTRACDKV